MKFGLSVLLACLFVSCTSSSRPSTPLDLPGVLREVDPSLALMTANGQAGHGCPVRDYVFTARHVMWNQETHQFEGASWSSRGQEGGAVVSGVSPIADIVTLTTEGGSIVYLPAGVAAPGKLVFWFEYDFRTKANALRARRRFAKIIRVVARQYVLDEIPAGGASGSCLLNERGEAIGIISGGWELADRSFVGVAPKLPEF